MKVQIESQVSPKFLGIDQSNLSKSKTISQAELQQTDSFVSIDCNSDEKLRSSKSNYMRWMKKKITDPISEPHLSDPSAAFSKGVGMRKNNSSRDDLTEEN